MYPTITTMSVAMSNMLSPAPIVTRSLSPRHRPQQPLRHDIRYGSGKRATRVLKEEEGGERRSSHTRTGYRTARRASLARTARFASLASPKPRLRPVQLPQTAMLQYPLVHPSLVKLLARAIASPLFTRNLSPLQSSKFSFEYLLLPPRSALEAASVRRRDLLSNPHALLLNRPSHLVSWYKWPASAPSIFRASSFGR